MAIELHFLYFPNLISFYKYLCNLIIIRFYMVEKCDFQNNSVLRHFRIDMLLLFSILFLVLTTIG